MNRILALVIPVAVVACGGNNPAPPAVVGHRSDAPDQTLIEQNKRMAQREEADIQDWLKRQGGAMIATGTGLRYKLLRDVPGDTARPGQVAVLTYTSLLLNGDTAYASAPGETASFRIAHSAVESGLQEGVQHLSVGDSAVLVIPSALAFGLIGDLDKIPMRSTVVYHIGLVGLED